MSFVPSPRPMLALVVAALALSALSPGAVATTSCMSVTAMTYSESTGIVWQTGNAVGVVVKSTLPGDGVTLGVTIDRNLCETAAVVHSAEMSVQATSSSLPVPVLP